MLWNNIIIALRNLKKNKVFAAINICGLALGLTVYVFGGLLVKYEETHDLFFENARNVYTIGSVASPGLNVGVDRFNATFSTIAPIINAELGDVEETARVINSEYLLTMGAESFYQSLRFADPAFLKIFDFEYLYGDDDALTDPSGLLITEEIALKYFGRTDVIGEIVTFDNEFDFHVTAVIKDLPLNSHFTSLIVIESPFQFIAPTQGLSRMRDWDLEGNWDNLSIGNLTYVMLPEQFDGTWLQTQVDEIYERMVPEENKEAIESLTVTPLVEANTAIWGMIGIPAISAIALLSLMVLIVACVNYTNLATAQSLGRTREVGMRKTMGATQTQLLIQFLVESLVIVLIAMLVAVAAIEIAIPLFNSASGKGLRLDYIQTLPWLLLTTVVVGLGAGLYPAWLITKTSPIDALRDIARRGKSGSRVRSIMIGAQFAMSAFMLAVVCIVYVQNEQVQRSSYEFPRSEIYTLDRLRIEGISDKLDTLRNELLTLPNVDSVAFSSQVPFEQSNSQASATMQPGDESTLFSYHRMQLTPEFFGTYDIPILAGRMLSRDISNDMRTDETEIVNVVVNELAMTQMGFASYSDAINQRFFSDNPDTTVREFVIVGIVPTQNIVGLFNEEKPWVFTYRPDQLRIGSIRITGGSIMDTIDSIEDVWDRVVPDYPMQGQFLDDVFEDVYSILRLINVVLAGFAFVALSLALIGLFGLAAFMAAQRTKEIGVRKVLGASSLQIARLLVWQFSMPVLWALFIALPAAFFASSQYLNFFADRIDSQIPILLIAGLIAVVLAWTTIAGHAIRIARSNPISALRYE